MPKLTANYSQALAALIRSGEAPIDGIEVGPWFTPHQIRQYQKELPGWEFQFHAGNYVSRIRYQPCARKRLREYLSCTQNPWLSVHLELLPLHIYLLSAYFGVHLDPPDFEKQKNWFIHKLKNVKTIAQVPIILENLISLPNCKYGYAADPGVITKLLEEIECGLLLDIAHARVAASYQGKDVERYLDGLSLDRVEQVHVSGVRMKAGYLHDAHESMQQEDYVLLEWVLRRSRPKVVTLEYFRAKDALRDQLWKLREQISDQASIWAGD
jgi:uncharacterized protein (UPF0276 family)